MLIDGINMDTSENEDLAHIVCDLKYLSGMMGDKKHLIKGVMDAFLLQVPEELKGMNEAVEMLNHGSIRKISHTMKSTVSIMGIKTVVPILNQMEINGTNETDIESTKELNVMLNFICKKAMAEIESQRVNYI